MIKNHGQPQFNDPKNYQTPWSSPAILGVIPSPSSAPMESSHGPRHLRRVPGEMSPKARWRGTWAWRFEDLWTCSKKSHQNKIIWLKFGGRNHFSEFWQVWVGFMATIGRMVMTFLGWVESTNQMAEVGVCHGNPFVYHPYMGAQQWCSKISRHNSWMVFRTEGVCLTLLGAETCRSPDTLVKSWWNNRKVCVYGMKYQEPYDITWTFDHRDAGIPRWELCASVWVSVSVHISICMSAASPRSDWRESAGTSYTCESSTSYKHPPIY